MYICMTWLLLYFNRACPNFCSWLFQFQSRWKCFLCLTWVNKISFQGLYRFQMNKQDSNIMWPHCKNFWWFNYLQVILTIFPFTLFGIEIEKWKHPLRVFYWIRKSVPWKAFFLIYKVKGSTWQHCKFYPYY